VYFVAPEGGLWWKFSLIGNIGCLSFPYRMRIFLTV